MGTPQAQLLQYRDIVLVDLAENAVNFADDLVQGHRVQVPIAADDLNTFFQWSRPAGQDRPVGTVLYLSDFVECLLVSFSEGFLDLDAVSTGLSYTTGTLVNDTNTSNSMNDIVISYILYKVYGKSSYNTRGVVYNVEDAFQMLENSTVAIAIGASIFNNNDRGQCIDTMFQVLLKTDPNRFFDSEGHQIPGLFEIHTDQDATGSWLFTAGDCIEIKLQFTFQEPVTRRVVRADQQPLTEQGIVFGEQAVEQVIIPKDATFAIRLQLVATSERSPARIYQLENGGSLNFVPTAPTNVVLSQTTRAGELAVSYTSGNSRGLPILGNHIYVYDESGTLLFSVTDTYLLTGLETRAYTITVRQRNSIGDGAISIASNPCTPITTVADPPTSIQGSQTANGGELQVEWVAPSYDGGEPILGYHVQIFDSQGTLVQDLPNCTSPLVVHSLLASETYTVQISTQNSVGESKWSQRTTPFSPNGTLPSEPISISFLPSSTSGELLASWSPPLTAGGLMILNYRVYLYIDEISTAIQSPYTTDPFLVFTNLNSSSSYTIQVTAINLAGEGPPSNLSQSVSPM